MMSAPPPLMEMSHEGGSIPALRRIFAFACMWEAQYRACEWMLGRYVRAKRRERRRRKEEEEGGYESESENDDENENALLRRGPSYLVSLLHSVYATCAGISHLRSLWHAPAIDKLHMSPYHLMNPHRNGHLGVVRSNSAFLSYLLYDLCHVLGQYPKLGGYDAVAHHLVFAACSVVNGTYGLFAFQFGWLYLGEASTIFLNLRWFLLKMKTARHGDGGESSGAALLDKINKLFAAIFFITRIAAYTAGMVHLFHFRLPELTSLPDRSGVPHAFLVLTCGCKALGWVLNIFWGIKIYAMATNKGGGDGKKKRKEKNMKKE